MPATRTLVAYREEFAGIAPARETVVLEQQLGGIKQA